MVAQYYRDSHGAIVVYDITSRQSFENVQDWLSDISNYCANGISVVIAGNKVDLEDSREVSFDEAQQYSKDRGYQFFETSAKTNTGVESVFRTLVQNILQSRNVTGGASAAPRPKAAGQQPVKIDPNQQKKDDKSGCCRIV